MLTYLQDISFKRDGALSLTIEVTLLKESVHVNSLQVNSQENVTLYSVTLG